MYYARRKKYYVESTFVTYKMVYKFLIDIIVQRWETWKLVSTHGTQINGFHKTLQIRATVNQRRGSYIRWAEDDQRLLGEGGIRYGYIRIK